MKEYLIIRNPTNDMPIADEEQYLNKMAKRGWELFLILDTIELVDGIHLSHCYDYYFHREIEIEPKLRKAQIKEESEENKK